MTRKRGVFAVSGVVGNEEQINNRGFIPTNRFDVIFRKLVFSLRLIGVPLDPPAIKKESRLLYYWSMGLGMLSIFLNMFLNFYSLVLTKKPNKTSELNVLINEINFSFTMLLTHGGIIFVTSMKWRNLFATIKRIEELHFFLPDDYVKFRKICVAGSLTILLVVGFKIIVKS